MNFDISYSIYETPCVFYIPLPKARGYKTQNSFHKYRMKWKFISDPICKLKSKTEWSMHMSKFTCTPVNAKLSFIMLKYEFVDYFCMIFIIPHNAQRKCTVQLSLNMTHCIYEERMNPVHTCLLNCNRSRSQ